MINILGFGTAFLLGVFHALEPGHGKTFITAFMIGNRGNLWHVLTLGLSLAFSHTLVLIFLGLGFNYFLHQSTSEEFTKYIELLSSIMILGLGGYMIYQSKKETTKKSCCAHGHHHEHNPTQTHHGEQKLSHRLTALAGFTGGLLPCPSALGAFFIAGSDGGLYNSLWFILIYVTGLVAALMLLALIVNIAKAKFEQSFSNSWISRNVSFLSGIIISSVGLVYLTMHLTHLH